MLPHLEHSEDHIYHANNAERCIQLANCNNVERMSDLTTTTHTERILSIHKQIDIYCIFCQLGTTQNFQLI